MVTVALVILAFTAGVTVTNYAYTLRIRKMLTQQELDNNKAWGEGHHAGWTSATQPSVVLTNYNRLFKTQE